MKRIENTIKYFLSVFPEGAINITQECTIKGFTCCAKFNIWNRNTNDDFTTSYYAGNLKELLQLIDMYVYDSLYSDLDIPIRHIKTIEDAYCYMESAYEDYDICINKKVTKLGISYDAEFLYKFDKKNTLHRIDAYKTVDVLLRELLIQLKKHEDVFDS